MARGSLKRPEDDRIILQMQLDQLYVDATENLRWAKTRKTDIVKYQFAIFAGLAFLATQAGSSTTVEPVVVSSFYLIANLATVVIGAWYACQLNFYFLIKYRARLHRLWQEFGPTFRRVEGSRNKSYKPTEDIDVLFVHLFAMWAGSFLVPLSCVRAPTAFPTGLLITGHALVSLLSVTTACVVCMRSANGRYSEERAKTKALDDYLMDQGR